jgi:hypothetical protein
MLPIDPANRRPTLQSRPNQRARLLLLCVWLGLLAACACSPGRQQQAAPVPTPDARLSLATPSTTPRAGASGAPVDCSVEVTNRSGQVLSRLVLSCELLDAEGAPVGSGLGMLQNVPGGERRSLRTVIYGVRSFASARAVVTTAEFR